MSVYGFNQKDVKRIGEVVKTVEKSPLKQQILNRKHKKRSIGGGGTTTLFGKVTAVTDANNYTVSVYTTSDLSDTPTTGQSCYVMSLVDSLAVDDVIPVQVTAISGKDYESIQQMGAVG